MEKCGIFLRVHVHFCSSSNLVLEPNALGVYLYTHRLMHGTYTYLPYVEFTSRTVNSFTVATTPGPIPVVPIPCNHTFI